jgi:hypothetical protein
MEPWKSWLAFVAIAAGAAYYYGLLDSFLGKNTESGPNRGRTLSRSGETKVPDWILAEEKKGAKAAKKQATAARKSVKKAVQEVGNKAGAAISSVTSATGAEADNETSDSSPSLANKIPSGKDVSDMLDPKSISNVLKINASEKTQRPAKPQQKKSEPQTKTKKQLQNEKKRQAEKDAVAAAEVERKKLMEKQLAGAREARGEAPGTRYRSSQAPASNAWNKAAAPAANEPANGQLLDTIDATSTASSATNGTAPTPDSTSYDNLPSEADQIAAALAESAWTTVPKGKKKKTTKANGEAAGEGSDSGIPSEVAPAPVKATPAPAPKEAKKENKKETAKPASRYEVLSEPISSFSDPRDSDWPVV